MSFLILLGLSATRANGIDIQVKAEERLHYSLGMHMMNDLHWNQKTSGNGSNVNNVMIYDDLSCGVLRDINVEKK